MWNQNQIFFVDIKYIRPTQLTGYYTYTMYLPLQAPLLNTHLYSDVTCFVSCHSKFYMNFKFFRCHLSCKAMFSLSQMWPLHTGLTLSWLLMFFRTIPQWKINIIVSSTTIDSGLYISHWVALNNVYIYFFFQEREKKMKFVTTTSCLALSLLGIVTVWNGCCTYILSSHFLCLFVFFFFFGWIYVFFKYHKCKGKWEKQRKQLIIVIK